MSTDPDIAPPTDLTRCLDGRRVAVIGSGDALARVLGVLHREGAACEAIRSPYHAAAIVTATPAIRAVVVVLPCVYPEELPVVGALSRLARVPVIVAAADGLMSALSAAIREGAAGILTERGVDWLSPPPSLLPPSTSPRQAAVPAVPPPPPPAPAPTHADPILPDAPEDRFDELAEESGPPPEPVLSAEELRALLQEPIPVARGVSRTTSAPNPDWT